MMQPGLIGVRTSNLTISQASLELRTGDKPCFLREVSIAQATGTAQSLALGRPAARGVTPGTTSVFRRLNSGDPDCETLVALTFGTSPTVPAVFLRRWNAPATIGSGTVWTFPTGLFVPAQSSVVVWNVTAAVACDVNLTIDEEMP